MSISLKANTPVLKLNLTEIIEDIFMVLTEKEREVVVQRFSLDNKDRRTLESIGRSFNVTRERVRQIEKIALGKLKRTVNSSKLRFIHEVAEAILRENGGLLLEEELTRKILNMIENTMEVDRSIVRLSLTICPGLSYIEKNNMIKVSWHLSSISPEVIMDLLEHAQTVFNQKKELMDEKAVVTELKKHKHAQTYSFEDEFFAALLQMDERIKKTELGYGLMVWRHINPKSIRDKALIVLRRENKPLHFVDIAKKIMDAHFDAKKVTVQAVHNELIRYPQFVLVGRGLYALKEWGFEDGTVTDIIESLLAKKSPLSKQDIIKGVLKQRRVKKGTISLNLQKNPQFIRVGRAVYDLDLSKKN
ncbi:MAG: sigma factor-like helix-turn-helix DNA-binding protein [Candidatus Gracilibacteria bacterium]|jgi:DNA-directed RNA polymerase delta subunit